MAKIGVVFAAVLAIIFFSSGHAYSQQEKIREALNAQKRLSNSNNHDSSLLMANYALKLATEAKDTQLIVSAMAAKGRCLFHLKKRKEAVDIYFEVLKICRLPAYNKQAAFIYKELGFAYLSQGLYRQSLEYYTKEYETRISYQNRDSVIDPLINISNVYQELKKYDSAQYILNRVADILSRNNDTFNKGYYYLNRGSLMQLMQRLDSTKYYYLLARDIWVATHEQHQLYKVTFNLGYLEESQQHFQKAMDYYKQAESSAKMFGHTKDLAHVYGTMAEDYAAMNDFKNAYNYLYLYATMNDSLLQSDFNSYVVNLDKQFQTEKNRATIQEQNAQLKESELRSERLKTTNLIIIILVIALVSVVLIMRQKAKFEKQVSQEVEKAKEKFFANVAHEIRTPLGMIQAPVSLLLESTTTDSETQQQLQVANRSIQRLNELINQMLDISKADSGAYKLNEQPGNFKQFVNDMGARYTLKSKNANLKFHSTIDLESTEFFFDRDALEKVMTNLLDNAIKYTPKGDVGFDVKVDEQNLAKITVWDSGTGIDKNEQAHIFERFYRVKSQESNQVKGIGIGLSLVKELVALMNGSIEVVSEKGHGAAFTVTFPLRKVPSSGIQKTNNDGPTILIVEDDTETRNFNQQWLTKEGFNIVCAEHGKMAVQILNDTLPDIIVTDLMMPEMDGIALLEQIRTNTVTEHIPVIILSARSASDARLSAILGGAQVYLPKPFQPAELLASIKSQLALLEKTRALFKTTPTETKATELQMTETIQDPFVQKCLELVVSNLDNALLSVEMLADKMFVNRSHFQRKLKTLTGLSPSEFIRKARMERAQQLLLNKEGNITEIAYQTGFTSQSYFTKCYSDYFGYPPSKEVR